MILPLLLQVQEMLSLKDLTMLGILDRFASFTQKIDHDIVVKYEIYSGNFNVVSLIKDSQLMLKPINHLLTS